MAAEGKSLVAVWDPLLRLFHWTLVAAVVAAVVTGKVGGSWMLWHGRIGLLIAGLLAFRLVWGVLGPETARFASFVRGPQAVAAYLRGQWHGVGHNPLGALSVVAMLTVLSGQVGLGLFANDEIAFRGPLALLLTEEWQVRLTGWHRQGASLVLVLVGLHVAAILFYRLVKGVDLVRPMVTGYQVAEPSGTVAPAPEWRGAGYWRRGLMAIAIGLVAATAASGLWLAPVQPAPMVAPAW